MYSAERVCFIPEAMIRTRVAECFEHQQRRLAAWLPDAEIHHIGSTAVPGSLTKGDLDIQVRIAVPDFEHADAVLAQHYERNLASTHSSTFSSFKDDGSDPELGIQLTGIGAPEDFFCQLRDLLIAHPELNENYNALKRQFAGASMDDYRAAKTVFMNSLLDQLSSFPQPNPACR